MQADLERTALAAKQTSAEARALVAVARVLRGGLIGSTALLATGAALRLRAGRLDSPAVRLFDLGQLQLRFEFPLHVHLRDQDPGLALAMAGVVLLAATPAMRVLALVTLWAAERDWRFAIVAGVVAITMALSIALGHG